MKIVTSIFVGLAVIASSTVYAEDRPDQIGNFLLVFGREAMTDDADIAAMKISGYESISFECVHGVPAIGFGVYQQSQRLSERHDYVVQIQVDDKPVLSVFAHAKTEHELYATEEKLFDYFYDATIVKFRIPALQIFEGETHQESLIGVDAVIELIRNSCGK